MNRQSFHQAESAASSDVLAAWRTSGGTIEALVALNSEAAGGARIRQDGQVENDRPWAFAPTVRAVCQLPIDDGLEATMNTALASCADDGLHAGGFTRFGCVEDGLLATGPTTGFCPHFGDDGLQAIMPTLPSMCYHSEDGLQAFQLTHGGIRAC